MIVNRPPGASVGSNASPVTQPAVGCAAAHPATAARISSTLRASRTGDALQAEPAQQRVNVPITERRQQRAPGQVHHVGPGTAAVQRVLAERKYAAAGHRQRAAGLRARQTRPHRAAHEQLLRLHRHLPKLKLNQY